MNKNKIILFILLSLIFVIFVYNIPIIRAYYLSIGKQFSGDINLTNEINSLELLSMHDKISYRKDSLVLQDTISNKNISINKIETQSINKKLRKTKNNIVIESNRIEKISTKVKNNTKSNKLNNKINIPKNIEIETPEQFDINLQFYPQAPYGDWRQPFQDACEEACVILAYNYIMGKEMTKLEFKDEILRLVARENENFGWFKDSNIRKTARIIEEVYSFTGFKFIDEPTIDDIEKELVKGNIIISPFYGKGLKNPYYSDGGPLYHFMVIKGYDKEHFITHDVGTSRGENFKYDKELIIQMIHDWNDGDVLNGEKKIIVLEQNQ